MPSLVYNMTLYAASLKNCRSSCVYSVLLPDLRFYFPYDHLIFTVRYCCLILGYFMFQNRQQ